MLIKKSVKKTFRTKRSLETSIPDLDKASSKHDPHLKPPVEDGSDPGRGVLSWKIVPVKERHNPDG
jgi:hypothetical protein